MELPEQPSTWDSAYTGVGDPTAQPEGIITVLTSVASDFSQMEADTKSQEVMDQKAYDEEKADLEIEKNRRAKESELKAEEKKRLVDKIAAQEQLKKQTN